MHHHHDSFILIQKASKGGRQVGQPVGSGNSCQRGKPEQVQRQMDESIYISGNRCSTDRHRELRE